ncbi:MAG: TPM domain-containing protein [Saprospiraceae bacterium]|nr:TPM domain-containing protein [Saprospiraceae bacterium]
MLFTKEEEAGILQAIRQAEQATSGEIRVFVEAFCDRDHPLERAAEIFHLNEMYHTKVRNAVLIYVAEKSRMFAIWGDAGIHEKVGYQFWDAEKQLMQTYLRRGQAAEGISLVITQIGEQLKHFFPANPADNENELPDAIIYG